MISSPYDNLIKSYHLPRIDEIPDLELYMDQVIIYVKKYFSIFPYEAESNFITPAMINNYVKNGLIPSPNGKKYNRRHIAYIFVVFFLKQIFSLEEVKAFINKQVQLSDEQTAYEQFCATLENELKKCVETSKEEKASNLTMLEHAALSIVHKLYAQSQLK